MKEITDEYMKENIAKTKSYTLVILKKGPEYNKDGARSIIWEHGRRNFSLKEEGLLPIVCPVKDETEVVGIGIFDLSVEQTHDVMDGDPGVKEGIFVYEIHPTRSFPGSSLPL
jgi:hypothetical protein